MQVVIRLHDNKGKEHNSSDFTLNDQATIETLKEKLADIFHIQPEHQQIFFGVMEIHVRDGLLSQIVTGNEYNFVVKHIDLDQWTYFERIADDINKGRKIQQNVQEAISIFQLLDKSKFFRTYPQFGIVKTDFEGEFANYIDTEVKMVQEAARHFFSKPDPLVPDNKVESEDKTSGVQPGTICFVTTPKGVVKYHIKLHMHASSRPPNNGLLDLREFFVYKLLELIGVGPEVFFIPSNHHSKFGFYIATRAVDNFVEKSDATDGRFNDEQSLKLDVLRHVLFLTDLHEKNYGITGNNDLIIVDFQIRNKMTASGVRNKKTNKKFLDIVNSWDLLTKINKADSEMSTLKILLKERGIEKQPSENYTRYLAQIRKNVELIQGESIVKDDEESVSNLDASDPKKPRYNP